MTKKDIKPGHIVQIDPTHENQMFAGCYLTVTEVKEWGVQGYVQMTGENEKRGGQAYLRPKWDHIELVGQAVWVVE